MTRGWANWAGKSGARAVLLIVINQNNTNNVCMDEGAVGRGGVEPRSKGVVLVLVSFVYMCEYVSMYVCMYVYVSRSVYVCVCACTS